MRWCRIPLPTPFPVGAVNVYLLLDEPLTLIDTGPYLEEAWQALGAALRSQGLGYGDLRRILITHTHPDHCGLVRRLQEESGAAVYLHLWEKQKMLLQYQQEPEWFLASGLPREAVGEARSGRDWVSRFLQAPAAVNLVAEGEEFAGDGYRLRVLHTPGHSSGHLCFYEPAEGLLWCGDTLLDHITPNPLVEPCRARTNGRTPSLSQFTASLARLADLEVKEALPGHGKIITDHRRRIAEMLAHHRQRAEEILIILRAAASPLTPWQLAERLYSGLAGENIFLAVSEVVAHLDVLASEGLVRQVGSEELLLYVADREGLSSY